MHVARSHAQFILLAAAALHGGAGLRAEGPLLAAGERHAAVLKPDGTLALWGYNSHGQCTAPDALGPVIEVAAGNTFTTALKADGTVTAWGSTFYGETTVPSGLTGVVAVACGGNHTVALTAAGVVEAWGENNQGQSSGPRGATNVIAVAAGAEHTLVLRSDGTVAVWGYDAENTGKAPAGLTQVKAIAAGYSSSIALKADGTVVAWGRNDYGECTVPAGLSNVIAIAGGDYHSVALKADGTVVGWGDNGYGQRDAPAGATGIIAIAAGSYHTVALRGDGTLLAWGLNDTGQLEAPAGAHGRRALAGGMSHSLGRLADGTVLAWGENGDGQSTVPALAGAKEVAAGGFHSVALKADGTVQTWGRALAGEAGAALSGIAAVAAGHEHAVALRANGRVSAWGDNTYGQCTVPAGLSNVVAIRAYGHHTSAVRADGTVVAWGRNDYGQCAIPPGTEPVKGTAVGSTFLGALNPAGFVTAWPYNEYGAVSVPPDLALVKELAAGQHHMAALKADGTVVCWGYNNYGQRAVPEGLPSVASIALGAFFTLALKADGTAQGWGDNGAGQLDFPEVFSPALPGEITVWDSIPPADTHMTFGTVFIGDSRTETLCISNASEINDLVVESVALKGSESGAESRAYGIDLLGQRLLSFALPTPGTVTFIGGAPDSGNVFATEFLDGDFTRLYGLDSNARTFVWYDTGTLARTVVGPAVPVGDHIWTGLAEDPTDGTLYASSSYGGNESRLYRINPATGEATEVGAITGAPIIIGIAINSEGALYGVDISLDNLVAIDKTTGAGTVVGPLGVNANYAQGLDFDPRTDVLYWGAYTDSPQLRTIDTLTGASTLVGAFPSDVEVELAIAGVGGDPAFELQSPPSFPLTLPPGSHVIIQVVYTPAQAGSNRTDLIIRSNDADEPEVRVALSGKGLEVPQAGPPLILPPSAIATRSFKARWQWAADAAPEGELGVSSNALFTQALPGYEARYVLNSPECTVTNLLPNRDYWYRVRSLMLDGSASAWSAPMRVRTGKGMPVFRNLLAECPVAKGITQTIPLTNLVTGTGRLAVKSSNSEAVKAVLTDQALTLQYLWKGTATAATVTLTLTHPDSGYKASTRAALERSTGAVAVAAWTGLSNVGTRVVQEVDLRNRTGKTIYGLRVKAGGLDDPAWLINRTGRAGGQAIREIPCILAPDETVTVRLIYQAAYRKQARTRPVQYQAFAIMAPLNGIPPPVAESDHVPQSRYDDLWLIGVTANRNRLYTILYSDDGGATWISNPTPVRATSNSLMWLDPDADAGLSRIYRVMDTGL